MHARPLHQTIREIPATERDACLNRTLDIVAIPDDGPDLPSGCVPYLPAPVDALLRLVERAPLVATDYFIDIGAGIGRAALAMHLLTGCRALGIEAQRALVETARQLARPFSPNVDFVHGDVLDHLDALAEGTCFFLYCPFSGARLARLAAHLDTLAQQRPIVVATLDCTLPRCAWLTPDETTRDLTIYRRLTP